MFSNARKKKKTSASNLSACRTALTTPLEKDTCLQPVCVPNARKKKTSAPNLSSCRNALTTSLEKKGHVPPSRQRCPRAETHRQHTALEKNDTCLQPVRVRKSPMLKRRCTSKTHDFNDPGATATTTIQGQRALQKRQKPLVERAEKKPKRGRLQKKTPTAVERLRETFFPFAREKKETTCSLAESLPTTVSTIIRTSKLHQCVAPSCRSQLKIEQSRLKGQSSCINGPNVILYIR